MKSARSLALELFILTLLAAACRPAMVSTSAALASKPLATSEPAENLEPAPVAPQFPVGHFRSLTEPGALVLAFHDRQHFQVFVDNALLDSGTLTIGDLRVSVDSLKCAARGYKEALYSWLYAESDLTFKAITPDPCPDRREYLAGDFEPLYLFVKFMPGREIIGGGS